MTTACAAIALAALGAAATTTDGGGLVVGSAVALLALACATGLVTPVYAALILLGAIYILPAGDRAIPAPLYAGALLLIAELAFWSLDERESGRSEPGASTPRLLGILAVVATGIAAGALVLLASEVDTARSAAGTGAGVAAILACVVVLIALARSRAA